MQEERLPQTSQERFYQSKSKLHKILKKPIQILRDQQEQFDPSSFKLLMQKTKNLVKKKQFQKERDLSHEGYQKTNEFLVRWNQNKDVNKKFDEMINGKENIAGNTWDSIHLDNFLNKSAFGQPFQSMRQSILKKTLNQENQENEDFQQKQNSTSRLEQILNNQSLSFQQNKSRESSSSLLEQQNSNNNQQQNKLNKYNLERISIQNQSKTTNKANNKSSSNAIQDSQCFFARGPARFQKGSIYNPLNFKSTYCDLNYLVSEQPIKHQENKIHLEKKLVSEQQNENKKFDLSSLEFTRRPYNLLGSKGQRAELQETKLNQSYYREFKQNQLNKIKTDRILQNEYKSGILNVDNPYNNATKLYEKQKLKNQAREKAKIFFDTQQNQFIDAYIKTNKNITFMNKWIEKSLNNNKNIEKYGPKNKYDVQFLSSDWAVKQKVEKDIVLDTNKKLTSLEKAHKRTLFLHDQDQRGRSFDVVNNCEMKLPQLIDKTSDKLKENLLYQQNNTLQSFFD